MKKMKSKVQNHSGWGRGRNDRGWETANHRQGLE